MTTFPITSVSIYLDQVEINRRAERLIQSPGRHTVSLHLPQTSHRVQLTKAAIDHEAVELLDVDIVYEHIQVDTCLDLHADARQKYNDLQQLLAEIDVLETRQSLLEKRSTNILKLFDDLTDASALKPTYQMIHNDAERQSGGYDVLLRGYKDEKTRTDKESFDLEMVISTKKAEARRDLRNLMDLTNRGHLHLESVDEMWVEFQRQLKTSWPDQEVGRITLTLATSQPNITFNIDVSYLHLGANWKPSYVFNALQDKVQMEYYAHVRQSTGEDWPANIPITVHTGRPSSIGQPGELRAMSLRYQRAFHHKRMHLKARSALQACGAAAFEPMALMANNKFEVALETSQVADSCTIQAAFNLPRTGAIPSSDKSEHRFVITSALLPSSTVFLAMPEHSNKVNRQCLITNDTMYLLVESSEAHLMWNGAYVGRMKLGIVAPKEDFQLTFGPEHSIHLDVRPVRTQNKTTDPTADSGLIGVFAMRNNEYLVTEHMAYVHNVKHNRVVVMIVYRLPISQEEKITVTTSIKNAKAVSCEKDLDVVKEGIPDERDIAWYFNQVSNNHIALIALDTKSTVPVTYTHVAQRPTGKLVRISAC